MPFTYTCTEHDEFQGDTIEPILAHLRDDHGGLPYDKAHGTLIVSRFVPMVRAQGNVPLNIFACRACGKRVETRATAPAPYCINCMTERT